MPKWDEMSSKERDILIATQVIGLPAPKESPINGRWIHHITRETYPGSGVFKEDTDKQSELKSYTTDISAAWQLVENLKICITPQSDDAPKEMAYMAAKTTGFYSDEIRVFAPTAPEAICIAALRALGVDV